jgi:hypothetical protein
VPGSRLTDVGDRAADPVQELAMLLVPDGVTPTASPPVRSSNGCRSALEERACRCKPQVDAAWAA